MAYPILDTSAIHGVPASSSGTSVVTGARSQLSTSTGNRSPIRAVSLLGMVQREAHDPVGPPGHRRLDPLRPALNGAGEDVVVGAGVPGRAPPFDAGAPPLPFPGVDTLPQLEPDEPWAVMLELRGLVAGAQAQVRQATAQVLQGTRVLPLKDRHLSGLVKRASRILSRM